MRSFAPKIVWISALFLFQTVLAEQAKAEAVTLYNQHCASCHGSQRYGGYAPPLVPNALSRHNSQDLIRIMTEGLPSTQMPEFQQKLKPAEIQSLATWLQTPVQVTEWGDREIRESHQTYPAREPLKVSLTSREEILLIVERGSGSIHIYDGKTMNRLDQFFVGNIHGGPKFDDHYESIYAVTRDGIIAGYELKNWQMRSMVRVAQNTRNIAISPDNQWVVAANLLPQNLVFLDKNLKLVKTLPLEGKPAAIYHLHHRPAFLVAFTDLPNLLLITYNQTEIQTESIPLPEPFQDLSLIPEKPWILASLREGNRVNLYDLEQRKILGEIKTEGLPHLFSAAFFMKNNKIHAALNHIGLAKISLITLEPFEVVKQVAVKGSGFFIRTHASNPWLWLDSNTDTIQLIRKDNFELHTVELQPQTGKKAMHIEFTADGKEAFVSIWDPAGAVVIYDARTLQEKQRIPFNMPIGKYNAYNKTFFPL
ncbi:MAG: c-type cytochrome [SAR324 cluster bacterium]|nr:c-type cytochrome [SAR324 cluster bacterium]